MYRLIIKQFIRSRAVVVTLSLLFIMGVVSIFIGRQFIEHEQRSIEQVTQHQHDHIERNVKYHGENVGLLLYYLRFALINKPTELAGLSIGQRDINPSVQRVTIRNLEAQKYDTDLQNPASLMYGNLDFGFVVVYLFPLVIIALIFNLLSDEKENATAKLVSIQSQSFRRYLFVKLSARAVVVYTMLFILFGIAIVVLNLPLDAALLAFVIVSVLYLAFWFALCFWITSLQKSSNYSALALLSLWLVLAIVLPAAVNSYVSNKFPVPESLSTFIKQRDGYHQKWDVDKGVTMEKFYNHYPQFRKYVAPDDEFSYTWYYAMQQMGDDEARYDSWAMRSKIRQREYTSRWWASFVPTMHAHLSFNELSRSSLENHLTFLDQTNAFHEKLRLYFYPYIFDNKPLPKDAWDSFTPEYTEHVQSVPWVSTLLPLVIVTAIFVLIAVFNMRKLVLH
ncbi:DUF3526 domain-containing protein [Pseudochryseolinea flava]|uniref:ABC transporter permease n=1 Tax=Pseudochryseolinea flava TaxID=2059302 RepID=A0A364Y5Z2_9BACT|nr:DUF3526 domain-containing protein [Pseudochryseolinea flava]RAW02252.1 ABC transporter permease [Pseudochryseolinea flava]